MSRLYSRLWSMTFFMNTSITLFLSTLMIFKLFQPKDLPGSRSFSFSATPTARPVWASLNLSIVSRIRCVWRQCQYGSWEGRSCQRLAYPNQPRPGPGLKRAEEAFQTLKDRFTTTLVLALPLTPKPHFTVEVDASDVGIGAVPSQMSEVDDRLHLCAFLSKKLAPAECNYDGGNWELLAVIHSTEPSSDVLENILSRTCLQGLVCWEVEDQVKHAKEQTIIPSNCSPNRLWLQPSGQFFLNNVARLHGFQVDTYPY